MEESKPVCFDVLVFSEARSRGGNRDAYSTVDLSICVVRFLVLLILESCAETRCLAAIDLNTVQTMVAAGKIAELKALGRDVLPVMARLYEASDLAQRTRIAQTFYALGWKSAEAKRVLHQRCSHPRPTASARGPVGSGAREQRRRRCGGASQQHAARRQSAVSGQSGVCAWHPTRST